MGWMPVWGRFHRLGVFLFRVTRAWVVWLNAFICRGRMNLDYSKVLMVLETLHSRFLNVKFHCLYLLFCILFLPITIKHTHWQTNQDNTTSLQKPMSACVSCWQNWKTLLCDIHICLQFFQQVYLLLQCHKDMLVKDSGNYTNIMLRPPFVNEHRRKQNKEHKTTQQHKINPLGT